MALTNLTTTESLEGFLSCQGLLSFSDGDDIRVAKSIAFATVYIYGRLSSKYLIANLVNCDLLEEFANVIAARNLCTTRGNPIPESLELRYQEIVNSGPDGLISQIAAGKLKLIDENGNQISGKGSSAPALSNLTVDRRYPAEQIRVKETASTRVTTKLERDSAFSGGVYDG